MALINYSRNFELIGSSPNRNFRVCNHDTGASASGKHLLVIITMQRTVQFTGASYDGVSMPNSTLVLYQDYTGLSQRQIVYTLANPSDGNNQFRVNFNNNQWGNVQISCYTFIGCAGVGNTGQNGGVGTPNNQTLTCSNGSIIMMSGISSGGSFSDFVIDGSNTPKLYELSTNKRTAGTLSSPVSAGSITCSSVVANGSNVTNVRVEMLEASAPPSSNSGNFLMMFN